MNHKDQLQELYDGNQKKWDELCHKAGFPNWSYGLFCQSTAQSYERISDLIDTLEIYKLSDGIKYAFVKCYLATVKYNKGVAFYQSSELSQSCRLL